MTFVTRIEIVLVALRSLVLGLLFLAHRASNFAGTRTGLLLRVVLRRVTNHAPYFSFTVCFKSSFSSILLRDKELSLGFVHLGFLVSLFLLCLCCKFYPGFSDHASQLTFERHLEPLLRVGLHDVSSVVQGAVEPEVGFALGQSLCFSV